jgi:hypothetical protein
MQNCHQWCTIFQVFFYHHIILLILFHLVHLSPLCIIMCHKCIIVLYFWSMVQNKDFGFFLMILGASSVRRSSPTDRKKTETGPDRNWKGPICKQPVAIGLSLHNNISKNPCKNTLKTMILWVFTCIFVFFWDKLLYIIMFCAAYTLYIIIPKICIQNLSVLYVISHKNCCFRLFSPVFNCIFKIPVLTGCGCQLPIFRPKNRTGPDLRTLGASNVNTTHHHPDASINVAVVPRHQRPPPLPLNGCVVTPSHCFAKVSLYSFHYFT